ncbi:MAG: D-glycerate dehydrogenase [Rhizobiales bacterium]|nr:D-glycerate dehydrogenase [Hyphomicrobiales bacterium]MBI3672844.1 D-glycerate dehydrogenase [Hyphomicrobiales bacterium]
MTTTGAQRLRLLATRRMMPDVEARLAASFDVTLNPTDTPLTRVEVLARTSGIDAILTCSLDKFGPDYVGELPASVRIIATHSVGYEHIDIGLAKARRIAVTNTPDVLTEATADLTLLLILGAARGASWGDRMVRENRWGEPSLISPLGFDVSGRRFGILGMGRIGQAVARRARGFGMALHYHSRRPVADGLAHGATYHGRFADMLPHCDFLSINCTSTPETRGIVNAANLALMPWGAILVNSSRGDIVDDDSVIGALQSGQLAAAGLDVFKGEPNIDPRYRSLDNVFLLPHLGSATPATRSAMGHRAIDNIEAFFRGERPRDLLTGD